MKSNQMNIAVDFRYPIGQYEPQSYSELQKDQWLQDIRLLPEMISEAVRDLNEVQLQTPYREGGWTVAQVVHHLADSHVNGYIRFKLGYTEMNPVIKSYDEKLWSVLKDAVHLNIDISIQLLYALHQRWYTFLSDLTEADFQHTVVHPEHLEMPFSLWHLLGLYAWHGRHHTAHITMWRERNNR